MPCRFHRWTLTPAVALVALTALAGCGRGAYEHPQVVEVAQAPQAAAPGPVGTPVDCPEAGDVAPMPAVDHVTGVLRCLGTTEEVPGDGEWTVRLLQRVPAASAGALLQAFALPSESEFGVNCAAVLIYPATIELETSSGRVSVAPPTGVCGQTRHEVVAAWQALPWATVATTWIKRERSESAVAADCVAWKDMIAIDGTRAKPGAAGPLLDGTGPVSVCLFRSTGDLAGDPTGGRQLTADEGQRLATLLAAAGPAAPCGATHTRFAVVGKSTPVSVELDGCMRILAPDNTLRQGGAELTTLLLAH